MADIQKEFLLECVNILFDRCLGPKTFQDYSVYLSLNDCISKDQRRELQTLEKAEGSFAAITQAHKYANVTEIITAFQQEEDFFGNGKIIDVVQKLKEENEFLTEIYWLFKSWDELILYQKDIWHVVRKIWPEIKLMDDWPLDFVHFILTSPEGRTNLKNFVQVANDVVAGQKKLAGSGNSSESILQDSTQKFEKHDNNSETNNNSSLSFSTSSYCLVESGNDQNAERFTDFEAGNVGSANQSLPAVTKVKKFETTKLSVVPTADRHSSEPDLWSVDFEPSLFDTVTPESSSSTSQDKQDRSSSSTQLNQSTPDMPQQPVPPQFAFHLTQSVSDERQSSGPDLWGAEFKPSFFDTVTPESSNSTSQDEQYRSSTSTQLEQSTPDVPQQPVLPQFPFHLTQSAHPMQGQHSQHADHFQALLIQQNRDSTRGHSSEIWSGNYRPSFFEIVTPTSSRIKLQDAHYISSLNVPWRQPVPGIQQQPWQPRLPFYSTQQGIPQAFEMFHFGSAPPKKLEITELYAHEVTKDPESDLRNRDSSHTGSDEENDETELSVLWDLSEELEQNPEIFKPIVKLCWPQDSGLWEDEKWPWTVLNTINSMKMTEMGKNVEKAFLLMADCINKPTVCKADNLKGINWISKNSQALSKHGEAMKILLRISWPNEKEMLSEKWLHKLIKRSKEDKETVCNFAEAAKIILRCFEVEAEKPSIGVKMKDQNIVKVIMKKTKKKLGGKEKAKADQKDDEDDEFKDAPSTLKQNIVNPIIESKFDFMEFHVFLDEVEESFGMLCMVENCWQKWKPISMQKSRTLTGTGVDEFTMNTSQNPGCYFIQIPVLDNIKDLLYKYVLIGDKEFYEVLSNQNKKFVNRVVKMEQGGNVIHDMPNFPIGLPTDLQTVVKRKCWHHLPIPNKILLPSEEGSKKYSLNRDVYAWLNSMKRGWRTNGTEPVIYISNKIIHESAVHWLHEINSLPKQEKNLFITVLCGISILMAYDQLKVTLDSRELLLTLSECLSMDSLSLDQQRNMYKEICLAWKLEKCNQKCNQSITSAFRSLFKGIDNLNDLTVEWILVLPTYWLIYNYGEILEKPRTTSENIEKWTINAEAFTPCDMNMFRKKCTYFSVQKSMMGISERVFEISKTHPWITGTFISILTPKTLGEMLQQHEKYKLSQKLPLDMIVCVILKEWKTNADKPLKNILDAKTYIESRCQSCERKQIKGLSKEKLKAQHQAALRILSQIVQVVTDMADFKVADDNNNNMIWFLKMSSHIATWSWNLVKILEESYEETRCILTIFVNAATTIVENNLRKHKDCFKFVSSVINISWTDSEFQKTWKKELCYYVEQLLPKIWQTKEDDGFLNFFERSMPKLQIVDELNELLEKYASKCCEDFLQTTQHKNGDHSTKENASDFVRQKSKQMLQKMKFPLLADKFGRILVKKFDLWHSHQSSKDIPEYSKTVEFLSSWPFAMPIFNHFYSSTMQNEKLGNKLTKIDECIIEIMQNTNDVIGLFKSGKLNISMIEMFIDNCGNLFEINSTINKEPRHVSNHDNMSSVDHTLEEHVRNRKKQIDAISLSYKFIVEFMELCALLNNEKIQMDMDTLGSFLHKPSSLLASVIDLYDIPENPNQGIHSYGNMGGAIAQRLYQISSIKGSEVFLKMWVAKGQDIFIDADCHHINKKKIVSWKMALFELWNKVQKDLESVFFDIQKGSLTISHVLHWFRFAMDTDNPRAAVTKEVDKIKLACGKSDENLTLKAKCRKICDILKAKLREDFADLIYEAQNCLELNDQFQELQQVQKVEEDMGNTLNQFKKESNYEFLNLTSRNVAVLRAFLNQQELFRWLKLNMQDRRGVKVFCDLGMISAGESAYEVDKVSCLLSAVIGFSPLIFDVSEDVSLEDFVKLCEEVGTNYAKDANLIQNWNDTSNRLEWFEMICNLHGSVENQSLMQVQEINKCGIYVIKKPNKGNIDMNNCVQLVLSGSMGKEGKEEKKEKILALNDLIDLQSKLMLIAGESDKGQEDVARFNEVLMAVETFTKAFVDLLNMGCMLFDDFNAKFICGNHENEISDEILMIIHFAEDAPPLSQTGTIKDIQSIAQVLMKAYEDWILRIDDLRNTYYYLNEFSQDQVVYLCKKLMQKHLPDQVFTLLNCHSIQDIKEALADLQEDEIQNDSCFTSNLPSSELEAEIDPNLIEKKVQLVKKIVDSCDEAKFDMTRAAVQDLGLADELDILTWIWDHEKDKELIIKLSEEFKNDEDFAYAEQNTTTYPQLLQNRDQFTLTEILFRASICEKLDPGRVIKTICCDYSALESRLKVKNFLNIKHLGKFLLKLKESISTASNICQKLYDPLKAGQPNIVVCPANEILIRIISFYNNNQNLPLPSNSEVLLCNRNTSADEVERFLKRVMFSCNFKSQLIHCMACADYLEDSVFSHLQKVYETLSVSANLDQHYKLVVLVSKQKHPIITYFDKYIIELKSHLDKNEISQYLAKKLVTCDDVKKPLITIVTSNRSGVGKSLYVQRKMDTLGDEFNKTTIRLLQKTISIDQVVEKLSRNGVVNNSKHFIHMDFTPAIQHGVDQLVFNLFILGSISNKHGKMWRRYPQHTYAIELTSSVATSLKVSENQILSLFPKILCVSPRKACQIYESDNEKTNEVLFDEKEFRSDVFQRPYQYLSRLHLKKNLDKFSYTSEVVEDKSDCINTLLLYCGITDPSWAQIKHFASFLNLQLGYCETSEFCKMSVDSKTFDVPFRGLKSLAIRFMIKMAQDLSTPSLTVSDESIHDVETSLEFASHQIRRKWEEENHPFVFFNKDHVTMTFMNVKCAKNGNILDENGIAIPDTAKLAQDLKMQNVPLGVSFDSLKRIEKLRVLCQFMGISKVFDPDPTYELTTDNALKMLAVYMRLQCDIPVIVMGETGCGKTRMVEFMSKLKAGSHNLRNMVTLKVHGGIESAHIYECVKSAQRLAEENAAIPEDEDCDLGTVLFFDGANTTEAIYAIKEVVCDFSIEGESFRDSNLKIVAACNPYKQLSAVAIKNLEESGLGYCVRESKDTEKVGGVSMRTLVYRVVSLPPSMQPFVWDFGQLTDDVERIYVAQMISHFRERLKLNQQDRKLIQSMICVAQRQVRKSGKDECRYVSLRDVERSIKTFEWFYNNHKSIFPRIEVVNGRHEQLSVLVRTLLQTLNVCYHASLTNRCEFRNAISSALKEWDINLSPNDIYEEFIACQIAFFNDLKMPDNIACNEALRENVFLMIVCAELRIPLFLVGKPGSSKSLAKTIVSDNMQGGMSSSQLCKKMKQVHMLSYQCSALTDANGIEAIFKQCTQLQAKQDLDKYVAVVVLDEIGLAEDSANMPLKVLHPLLECGSTDNSSLTDIDPKMKVGFIGISNWSLDPAKMNRGIFVTRTKMKKGDLKETAKGIFANQTSKINEHATLLNLLTNLYLEVYESQREEYFGLRDYYSLIKMIYSKCVQKINGSLTQRDVEEAVSRNFGGGQTDYKKIFRKCMDVIYPKFLRNPISVQDMLAQNLKEESSRFLLILTNQVSSVDLLKLALKNCRFQIVFGSTFPNDSTYTERCRNINRVKVCMENGRTVVLLNLSAIHESLYDVLNQQYVSLRNQRYVDLGLGGHRVKSRIAQDFRLIVLEQKDIAYTKYPIPLLNRLEKHHLTAASMIQGVQKETVKNIDEWVCKFTDREGKFSTTDCFIGFHEDTVASILLSGYQNIEECQHVLLNSAAPESVFRLPKSRLQVECKELQTTYLQMQTHDNLWDLLLHLKNHINESVVKLLEIPSYSDILSGNDRKVIETYLDLPTNHVMLMSLQQIKTNQEFIKKLGDFLNQALLVDKKSDQQSCMVLLIQCAQAHKHVQLIACARYGILNTMPKYLDDQKHKSVIVAFLLSTDRTVVLNQSDHSTTRLSSILQPTSDTETVFIDEFKPHQKRVKITMELNHLSISELLSDDINHENYKHVHIPTLLKDCVWQAMSKLSDSPDNDDRLYHRIKILTELFSGNTDCSKRFLNIFIKKLNIILDQKNKEDVEHETWLVKEACDFRRLQDGGSFGKTLWLCLKRHVSVVLAYITSILDEDDNLNIIEDVKLKGMHNMWLQIFDGFEFHWHDIPKNPEFRVLKRQLYIRGEMQIPFSSKLRSIMDIQWIIAGGNRKIFFNLFRTSQPKIACAIGEAWIKFKQMDFIKSYASALIYAEYKAEKETECLASVLCKAAFQKLERLKEKHEFANEDALSIIFHLSKKYSKHLQIILDILKMNTELSIEYDEWIKGQSDSKVFIVHELALDTAITFLDKGTSFKDEEECRKWIILAKKLKHIFYSSFDLIGSEEKKQDIFKKWERLSVLNLLLLHLLPDFSDTSKFAKYAKVISTRVKMLSTSLKNGFRNQAFFRRMLAILKRYYNSIKSNVKMNWKSVKCCICKNVACTDFQVLSCGDFAGRKCIPNHEKCPLCMKKIDRSSDIRLTELEQREVDVFLANCTSFFLEFLSQFCFSENAFVVDEVQDDDIRVLLECIVFNCKSDNESKPLLLPNITALDINIHSQSAILTMIIMKHDKLVEKMINEWISNYNPATCEKTMTVLMRSLEQKSLKSIRSYKAYEKILKNVRTQFAESLITSSPTASTLSVISDIRYCLCYVAAFIQNSSMNEVNEDDDNDLLSFIYTARNFCNDDKSEQLKEYLVKIGCHEYGMEWFNQLVEKKAFKDFIPSSLVKTTSEQHLVDYWSLLGKDYLEMRSILNKNNPTKSEMFLPYSFQPNTPFVDVVSKLLALVTFIDDEPKHLDNFKHHIAAQGCDTTFDYLLYVYQNIRKSLARYKLSQQITLTLLKLSTYASGVMIHDSCMLKDLRILITEPGQLQLLYMPGMPESRYFSLPSEILALNGKEAYRCPNGHLYLIGNCAMPVTEARCTDCNALIGGKQYHAAPGNTKFTPQKRSQAGYKLLIKEPNTDDPTERLTKQGVAFIHLLIHCGMLSSLQFYESEILTILKKDSVDSANDYLVTKLLENLQDLSSAIGRNIDATIPVVFEILHNMCATGNDAEYQGNWKSMENRKIWETEFYTRYIMPVFQNIDGILIKAQNNINSAEDLTSMTLHRLVYEIQDSPVLTEPYAAEETPSLANHPPSPKFWSTPSLWNIIDHPSSSHLLHCIRTEKQKNNGQVVQIILEMQDLNLLQHLKMVLDIQGNLIDRYQNKIDINEAEKITLKKAVEDEYVSVECAQKYINLWNTVFPQVQSDLKSEWLENISLESPISVALPSTRGRGKCAKFLSEHLIYLHNTFLIRCKRAMHLCNEITAIDVPQLLPSHFVKINPEKDFLTLIELHSSYNIEVDETGCRHHIISYNISALEKQAQELFCMYKKMINVETLPCMKYPQDIGIGQDWQAVVRNTEEQVPLPINIIRVLEEIITESSLTQICDAVRILTHSINFLAKVKCDCSRSLLEYLRKDLLFYADTNLLPNSTEIRHTLSLYQYLTWKKFVHFVQIGINPYQEALSGVKQESIPDKLQDELLEAFETMNVGVLQQQINELLIQANDLKYWADYSLVEDILPYHDFIGNEESTDSRFEKMSKDICFKHISHLFELTVRFAK